MAKHLKTPYPPYPQNNKDLPPQNRFLLSQTHGKPQYIYIYIYLTQLYNQRKKKKKKEKEKTISPNPLTSLNIPPSSLQNFYDLLWTELKKEGDYVQQSSKYVTFLCMLKKLQYHASAISSAHW